VHIAWRSSARSLILFAPGALALGTAATVGVVTLAPRAASAAQTSTLTLTSSAQPGSFNGPGQSLAFSYVVTNTGGDTLYKLRLDDSRSGLSPISCPNPVLAAGAAETCTASYTTTQADFDRGFLTDVATASADLPSESGTITSAPANLTVPDDKSATALASTMSTPGVTAAPSDSLSPAASSSPVGLAVPPADVTSAPVTPAAAAPAPGVTGTTSVAVALAPSPTPPSPTPPSPTPRPPGGVSFVPVPFPVPIHSRDGDKGHDGIGVGVAGVGVGGAGVGGVGPAGTSPLGGAAVPVTG
jgi:hypothetical protein